MKDIEEHRMSLLMFSAFEQNGLSFRDECVGDMAYETAVGIRILPAEYHSEALADCFVDGVGKR